MENFDASANVFGNQDPQLIGSNLRIENLLGRGGMGTVYRATHLTLDRVVAVKIINADVAANADITQRFAREARLMAKLRHPRAAMIYDSGSLPDGRLFIVMEYVEGVTLADVLNKEGKLPYQKAIEIAVSICDVLSEAHSLGIIHRDLKPANIMLNQQGVFVLDFGIAKMLKSDNAESLKLSMTGNGSLIGTPYYMSPEQCLGEPVEARSDLYSLGALLFEMLSGRPPFDEEVFSAIIIKHAMVEAPKIEEIAPDIPPALAHVVNQLLAKKPENRPANAAATKALLESAVSGQTASSINFATQNHFAPASAVTQQMKNATVPLMANRSAETAANSSTETPPASGGKRAYLYGIGAFLILAAALSIAAFVWMKSQPKQMAAINNPSNPANANSSTSNMSQMNHTMVMGDDFAKAKQPNDEKINISSAPLLSAEEADKVITSITQTTEHRADGMQIIKTPKDTALVCIHNMIEMGKTHMFAVERPNPNSQWEITARVSLDTPDFHGANWTFEPQDVDNDGFEDVIFHGANADDTARKVLIYVPRTRQNYWITAAKDANGKFTKTTLSPNAETPNSKAFRAELEQAVK
ncbi:MAG: serine/threonine-protein kinase [Pyrinomonadaceae bacterium]